MINFEKELLFVDYFSKWIDVYKKGAIAVVTMRKYNTTLEWLMNHYENLLIKDIDRMKYQEIINEYALTHEKQTTMDFHHQIKGAIIDAVDEGYISKNPTRKVIIKGKPPRIKKTKYINQYELQRLLKALDLNEELNIDWLIFLIAKTGMRFSEALAITPSDFDFQNQFITVSKTWDYKFDKGFLPTKNKSSVRKIRVDWQTASQFKNLVKDLNDDDPIFINKKIYNSTVNELLKRRCLMVEIPIISIHGLRHTHASILLYNGVSIASVSSRLGHSNMTTTQQIYLHIIQELENKDIDIIMRALSTLL